VVLFFVVLITLSGCAGNRPIVINPIYDEDFHIMKAGEAYTPVKDGYFIGNETLQEVFDVNEVK